MRRRIAILAVWLLVGGALRLQAAQRADVYRSDGPYLAAEARDFSITDHSRGLDVPVRVRFPVGDGPFPLIVFSHGLGANREAFESVSQHWVTHGYVVFHPSHDDTGVGMTGGGMHPSGEKVRARLADVLSVFDGLDQLETVGLEGRIDVGRMAVAGHSYGSFITMAAGGITIDVGDETGVNLGDPRIRCVLPISPSGRGDYGMGDRSFNSLTMPAMIFTGTNDIRNGRVAGWRMEPYHLSPKGEKYLIVIEGATHNAYGGETGNAGELVKAASTAYWDACLNGSEAGRRYLTRDSGFREFAGGGATIEFK